MAKTLVATTNDICDVVATILRTSGVAGLNEDHVKLAVKREYITAQAHNGGWKYAATVNGRRLLRRRLMADFNALTKEAAS